MAVESKSGKNTGSCSVCYPYMPILLALQSATTVLIFAGRNSDEKQVQATSVLANWFCGSVRGELGLEMIIREHLVPDAAAWERAHPAGHTDKQIADICLSKSIVL